MRTDAVVHTVGGLFTEHGGTSRSVPALCDALAENEVRVTLVTAAPATTQVGLLLPRSASVKVVTEAPVLGRLLGGRRFASVLNSVISASGAALIHDHGIWLPSNHAAVQTAVKGELPVVVSPRGMLSNWSLAHRAWRKALAWRLYQHGDLAAATAFHATSSQEAMEIRDRGFSQPIAVIPNGIEGPKTVARSQMRGPGARIALFLSRVHPKKGLEDLLHAWGKLRPVNWQLWIAGPDEGGYRGTLEALAQRLGIQCELKFLGEIQDARKWGLYSEAQLFVLPSYNENFGMVIGEALAAGLPVITTTQTPWGVIPEVGAGWIVQTGVDSLASALQVACAMEDEDLALMGGKGREWARTALGWAAVAARMKHFYDWLLSDGRDRPDWILV